MKNQRKSRLGIVVSGAIAGLTACSGGGGGGGSSSLDPNVGGLTMPDRLSVVTAKTEEPAAKITGMHVPFGKLADVLPTSGAYVTDQANVWVNDDSIRALGTVNMILCMVAQTRADEMVNVNGTGRYVALINEDKCDEEKAAESGAEAASTQSTAAATSTAVSYNRWTVESTRASSTSPQILKAWIPGKTGGTDPREGAQIMAKVTITEPVSETKPFGAFEMLFEGFMPDGTRIMRGNLRTVANASGQTQFEFINLEGGAVTPALATEFTGLQKAAVIFDADDSGRALTYEHQEQPGEGYNSTSNYLVAFNQNYFLRADDAAGTNGMCTERTSFDTQIFQYNVYDTAGTLVKLNSGFPFHFSNSSLGHGNIGYWGIWTDQNLTAAQLADQTIVRESWGNSAVVETYTLKVSAGRLQKRSKHAATLADIQNVELNWWGDPDGAGGNACSGTDCPTGSYIAVYDGDSVDAIKKVTWNENAPPTYAAITSQQIAANGDAMNAGYQVWFYSDALGGSVNLIKDADGAAGNYDVVYYSEEWLRPGAELNTGVAMDGTQLVCYQSCPMGTTAAGFDTTPADATGLFYPGGGSHTYTVHAANGLIRLTDADSGSDVDWSGVTWGSLNPDSSWLANGARSGFMVLSTDTAGISNDYDVNNKPLTFAWQMGSSLWNHNIAALRNGTVHSFDKPRQFSYVYQPLTDEYSSSPTVAANALFMLEYGGPGQLHGFPWAPEDPACTENCRWKSSINLKDGVEITDTADGTTKYVLRGMAKEQRMKAAAGGMVTCANAGLSLAGLNLTLPTSVVGSLGFAWTDKPNVTDDPAVIEGEVQ